MLSTGELVAMMRQDAEEWSVSVTGANDCPAVHSFDDLALREGLRRGISSCGFERPRVAQQHGLRHVLPGRDAIVVAPSGTGSTSTLAIAALQRIDFSKRECQALLLAPTRELAQQIQTVVLALGDYSEVRCQNICDVTYDRHIRDGQNCIVGTPGRVLDAISNRHLQVDNVVMFVLDEAHRILSRDEVCSIFKALPANVQVCLFSAAMTPKILDLTNAIMRDAVRIVVKRGGLTLDGVRQFHLGIEREEWKVDTLCDIYTHFRDIYAPFPSLPLKNAIVYCNTPRNVDFLADRMTKAGFSVSTPNNPLGEGEDVWDEWPILRPIIIQPLVFITTDLFARGSDEQRRFVINYDLPEDVEKYLYRLGRSRRSVGTGVAINFVTADHVRAMKEIARYHHTWIEEMPFDIEDIFAQVDTQVMVMTLNVTAAEEHVDCVVTNVGGDELAALRLDASTTMAQMYRFFAEEVRAEVRLMLPDGQMLACFDDGSIAKLREGAPVEAECRASDDLI